jgi:hypothetical protein
MAEQHTKKPEIHSMAKKKSVKAGASLSHCG